MYNVWVIFTSTTINNCCKNNPHCLIRCNNKWKRWNNGKQLKLINTASKHNKFRQVLTPSFCNSIYIYNIIFIYTITYTIIYILNPLDSYAGIKLRKRVHVQSYAILKVNLWATATANVSSSGVVDPIKRRLSYLEDRQWKEKVPNFVSSRLSLNCLQSKL